MKSIENVLEKIKEVRKERGYSHENMASELGISQAAYTNLEKNYTKLTVERLIKISEILNKPVYAFFESSPQNNFNQQIAENATANQSRKFYQESTEANAKLTNALESIINHLKEEILFLRMQLEKKQLH